MSICAIRLLSASEPPPSKSIPLDQLGAEAQKQYSGDGISIQPTANGGLLRAIFQKLEAEATCEGLWLTSTASAGNVDRFLVRAEGIGREECSVLAAAGHVVVGKQEISFVRPGLVEEYRVSMDGVRQDFVVLERPVGAGELKVSLKVSGAVIAATTYGAKLKLPGSGREIAYSRLKVTDSTDRVFDAQMTIMDADHIQVRINDTLASYPLRIDPTFSDADWLSMGGIYGPNSRVSGIAVDGSGNLYISGSFTMVGEALAYHIAKWNGNTWSALGKGMNGTVATLATSGTDLYAGGAFTTADGVSANNIAKWNGNSWSALGAGVNDGVSALAVSGTDLYAGGFFTLAGGVSASRIAKWDGQVWTALGSGMGAEPHNSNRVCALAVSGSDLYAAGNFTTAGGVIANNIAKWNGSSWSVLGAGTNSVVWALAVSGTKLYAGGYFTKVDGLDVNFIAQWDGSAWSPLGSGTGWIFALAVSGTDLYAGGVLSSAGGVSANNIAKWNGSAWSSLGSGLNAQVDALAVYGGTLYAGGVFNVAGGVQANYLAQWNGSIWSGLGSGMNGRVRALAVSGTDIYAGGDFTHAGAVSADHLAKWDGTAWSSLGQGLDGSVRALVVSGSDLYAGGDFTHAGAVSANRIAKWNGSTWIALGSGMNDKVNALAVSGTNLYAGGHFTTAGGAATKYIAKWNGSAWSALGSGMDDEVNVLAVSGTTLYAGGTFIKAGGISAFFVAKWNGSAWGSLGTGVDGVVTALAASGAEVYAGGGFGTAGRVNAIGIAMWNGSSWSPLGSSSVGFGVYALAVSGRNLYAGGVGSGNRIAKWNGAAWSALGSGVRNGGIGETTATGVYALAAVGTDLYVGGDFTLAGIQTSGYVAHALVSTDTGITIVGRGAGITSGSITPSISDDTDFNEVGITGGGTLVHTFTIINTTTGTINLTGTPKVEITGANAGDFSVALQPANSLAPGGSTTFQIAFTPSAPGLRTGTVSIANNATEYNPFTFAIQGTGVDRTAGIVGFSAVRFWTVQNGGSPSLTITRSGGTLPIELTINTHDGTASSVPKFSAAVAGKDYIALSDMATKVTIPSWEKSVTIPILVPIYRDLASIRLNQRFTATLSNPTNGAVLGPITTTEIQILALDFTQPSLTIATPAAGSINAALPYAVTGVAGDAMGIERVEVTLNDQPPVNAVLGKTTTTTSVPYSLQIMPANGLNKLVISAHDLSGNIKVLTREFDFTRRPLLTLARSVPAALIATPDSAGTVMMSATPAAAATALTPALVNTDPKTAGVLSGSMLKLTATPKAGYVFDRWLGLPAGAFAVGNAATFNMPATDSSITAGFIAAPFAPPAGQSNSFFGLIHPTGVTSSSNATEGFLTGTLTASSGAFTGKVIIDGVSQPLTATFFGDGSAVFTNGATKQNNLTFGGRVLTLMFDTGTGTITASLTKDTETSAGTATRARTTATKGFYTLAFPATAQNPTIDTATYPQGSGFATLNVTSLGATSLTGTLADGTSITTSSAFLTGNTTPFFVQLSTPGAAATKGGSFSGTLAFYTTQDDSDVTATDLLWFRPAAIGTTTPLYTAGWPNGIRVNAFGALYATTTVQATIGLDVTGNARLHFTDGKLNPAITKTNFKIIANTVTKNPTSDASYALALAPATGSFNGSFIPNWLNPSTTNPAFKGILIQKGNNKGGYGHFLSNAKNDPDPESGCVILSPPSSTP
jgi:hypothetical protein